MVVNDNEVLKHMSKNVIGKLGAPRMKLIKALLCERYGDRQHTAQEMLSIISDNNLQLYTPTNRLRPEKQIQDAMSIAAKMLKNKAEVKAKVSAQIDHHPSCPCTLCEKKEGEHIITSPHS